MDREGINKGRENNTDIYTIEEYMRDTMADYDGITCVAALYTGYKLPWSKDHVSRLFQSFIIDSMGYREGPRRYYQVDHEAEARQIRDSEKSDFDIFIADFLRQESIAEDEVLGIWDADIYTDIYGLDTALHETILEIFTY